MLEFLSMGGYAAYVWSAFGVSLIAMLALFVTSVTHAKKSAAEFEALKAELRPRRADRPKRAMRARRASETAPETGG